MVHPTVFIGTERERAPELLRDLGFNGDEWIIGMDFPANSVRSYYSAEEAFAVMVRFTLDQLVAQRYSLIVIVNGHGATNQINQLQRLAAEFSQRGPAKVLYTFRSGCRHRRRRGPCDDYRNVGHAGAEA